MTDSPTVATYNQYAQVYDEEVIDFWNKFPKSFLDAFTEQIPGNRILNLGSGSGRDAVLLRDYELEVICVDASSEMIDMTKRMGFESQLADFSQLDFPLGSFDGVWAYTSLIHIPKDEARQVIAKIRKLLKPSGIFAIGVIEGDSAGMVERKTMPGTSRYFKNYSSKELRELIEPLGFKLTQEHRYQPHNNVYLNQIYQISPAEAD